MRRVVGEDRVGAGEAVEARWRVQHGLRGELSEGVFLGGEDRRGTVREAIEDHWAHYDYE